MEVIFADDKLDKLETDLDYTESWSKPVVRAFRKAMQMIRNAPDERDFRALKSLHFEKLSGARQHQHSMRLNEQFRLILEFQGAGSGKVVVVVGIEDYH